MNVTLAATDSPVRRILARPGPSERDVLSDR